jgi:peptidoglycan/xylan/chitin deacetylase (PgdA/CDA1 family)
MIIPILLYHSIAERASPKFEPWTVTPGDFQAQMQYLSDRGYTALTVSELTNYILGNSQPIPSQPVVITFDDGFANFYSQALPTLAQFGYNATIYIATAYVMGTSRWLDPEGSGDIPMLTWDQISALADQNVEVGAHSHTHPQLDTLPSTQADQEIRISKSLLEDHLRRQIQSFAYPHGYHNPQVRRLIQAAGFTSACAVKHAMSSPEDDRFAFSRVIIDHYRTLDQYGRLLTGESLRIAPRGERVQTILWRVVRRTMVRLKRTGQPLPIR